MLFAHCAALHWSLSMQLFCSKVVVPIAASPSTISLASCTHFATADLHFTLPAGSAQPHGNEAAAAAGAALAAALPAAIVAADSPAEYMIRHCDSEEPLAWRSSWQVLAQLPGLQAVHMAAGLRYAASRVKQLGGLFSRGSCQAYSSCHCCGVKLNPTAVILRARSHHKGLRRWQQSWRACSSCSSSA